MSGCESSLTLQQYDSVDTDDLAVRFYLYRYANEIAKRDARLSAGGDPATGVCDRQGSECVRAVRLRAARNAGVREYRDLARKVRRRGQQAHLQDSSPRRARSERRG